MNFKSIARFISCLIFLFIFVSCKKYLDKKSNQQLSTPDTVEDLQALLNNESFYMYTIVGGQTGSDDYYMPLSGYNAVFSQFLKQGYLWVADADDYSDWFNQYQLVLLANTVLDGVGRLSGKAPGEKLNEIKGTALFLRAYSFSRLMTIFAPQYDPQTAGAEPGIVLRLEPDFLVRSKRASVQQSYDQIIKDLREANELMPANVIAKTLPNKAAGYGLLARVYLQIGEYQKAVEAANQSLNLYATLIDYNNTSEVNPAAASPFINVELKNKEISYYVIDQESLNVYPDARVDSNLYNSYNADDIRKAAFFSDNGDGTFFFKGSYNGDNGLFTGLGTAEVYLIRSEANARLGKISEAMNDINTLLTKRYRTGKVPVFNPANSAQAVDIVLAERRKELAFRGTRWADLKRLNKESGRATTLTRNLDGATYTLPSNDPRYTLLIPRKVMELSNLEQNPR